MNNLQETENSSVECLLSYKQYQPELGGSLKTLPERYTVHVERSDGESLSPIETITALEIVLAQLKIDAKAAI